MWTKYPQFYYFLGGVGCVLVILAIIKLVLVKKSRKTGLYPYKLNDNLLNYSERSFYRILSEIIGDQWRIFAKVQLTDIIEVCKGQDNYKKYYSWIQSKHIDFLLCDGESLDIKLAIILDDSHQKTKPEKKKELDICKNIGLEIVKIPAQRVYSVDDIKQRLSKYLHL